MGYTTEFEGQFDLMPLPLPAEVVLQLYDLEGIEKREANDASMPASYNQWELTKDRRHLAWDGGEKFYNYVEWLQWLIDIVFTPAGITVSGSVSYSGEEVTDTGVLKVEDGIAVKQQHALVKTEVLSELQAFYQFVLMHEDGEYILRDWYTEQRSARKES